MSSTDQGNIQGKPPAGIEAPDQAGKSHNQQNAYVAESEEAIDIGIEGFSYGEVRRVDRGGNAGKGSGNEQSDRSMHQGNSN
jgi:hypothetical protein